MDNKNERKLYVNIIGKTNSGKSTLINEIISKKITATSKRPHTTTRIMKGVCSIDNHQIIFLDTPGITYLNGSTVNNEKAKNTINEQNDNLNIFVFPANRFFDNSIVNLSRFINVKNKVALISKIDTVKKLQLLPMTQKLKELGFEYILYFSMKDKISIQEFKKFLITKTVEGEWDYDGKTYTDNTIDELLKEATKEILFEKLYDELPYSIKVLNDTVELNDKNEYVIHQSLLVKKSAHHILLGIVKQLSIAIKNNIQKYLNTSKLIHLYITVIDGKSTK
jgi:GTP-binding protein Era